MIMNIHHPPKDNKYNYLFSTYNFGNPISTSPTSTYAKEGLVNRCANNIIKRLEENDDVMSFISIHI